VWTLYSSEGKCWEISRRKRKKKCEQSEGEILVICWSEKKESFNSQSPILLFSDKMSKNRGVNERKILAFIFKIIECFEKEPPFQCPCYLRTQIVWKWKIASKASEWFWFCKRFEVRFRELLDFSRYNSSLDGCFFFPNKIFIIQKSWLFYFFISFFSKMFNLFFLKK